MASFYFKAPVAIIVLSFVMMAAILIFYLGFFAYFAIKAPDFLRSERYTIQRLALEKGFVGDDRSGVIDVEPNSPEQSTLVAIHDEKTLPKPSIAGGGDA